MSTRPRSPRRGRKPFHSETVLPPPPPPAEDPRIAGLGHLLEDPLLRWSDDITVQMVRWRALARLMRLRDFELAVIEESGP